MLVAGLQPNGKAVPRMVVRGKFSIRTVRSTRLLTQKPFRGARGLPPPQAPYGFTALGVFVLVAGLQPNGKAVPIMVVRGKFSNCLRTL